MIEVATRYFGSTTIETRSGSRCNGKFKRLEAQLPSSSLNCKIY
jgi:hypothetical protein